MTMSPILLFHICAGTVGLLSGAVAISFRKGSRRHGLAGIIFVMSMLGMSAAGAYMAVMKFQPGNILGGTLTFYLVATAWLTVKRRDGETGTLEWAALLVILALTAIELIFGIEAASSPTGLKYGYSPGPYFFLGSVALLAVVGDVRMLLRGGVSGAPRIARHLWRMCFALFIASGSVFLARQRIFPAVFRKTGLLYLLTAAPLLLMVFWLIRVRFKNAFRRITSSYPTPKDREVALRSRWRAREVHLPIQERGRVSGRRRRCSFHNPPPPLTSPGPAG